MSNDIVKINIRRKAGAYSSGIFDDDTERYEPYRMSARITAVSEDVLVKALAVVHKYVVASTKARAWKTGLLANSFIYCVQGGEIRGLNSAGGGAQVDEGRYMSVLRFPKYKTPGRVSGFVGTFVSHSMEVGTKSTDSYQYASIVEYGGNVVVPVTSVGPYSKALLGSNTVSKKPARHYFRSGLIEAQNSDELRRVIGNAIKKGLTGGK